MLFLIILSDNIFFMKSRENLAEEKYITILQETCRKIWVKFKHWIGYWYWPSFEFEYQPIGKMSY